MERQHGVAHLNAAPDLEPQNPRIHISVMDNLESGSEVEWDVRGCASFLEEAGRWEKLRPGEKLPK